MRRLVVLSAKESQQGEQIPVKKFAFNKKYQSETSEFEVTFIKEGVRYQYGFINEKIEFLKSGYLLTHLIMCNSGLVEYTIKKMIQYFWKFSKFFKAEKNLLIKLLQTNFFYLMQ